MANDLAVIFDLDGTLTDSKPGIMHCLQDSLRASGIGWEGSLDWFIGPPVEQSFARLMPDDDEASRESVIQQYRGCYDKMGWSENSVYPGVPELLQTLGDKGVRLFVCTSKRENFALRVLEHFKLDWHFAAIYADRGQQPHTKVELLATLLEEQRLDPARCFMVGDRDFDMKAANANGVAGIAVSYGYGSPEELAATHPLAICATPAEVLAVALTAAATRSMIATTAST